jgi:predicted Zn-ribbon and HTH transcriptional regulator
MLGEKIVTVTLKPDIAKWVEKLSEMTRMSDEEVVEGALYLLRLATSTEMGRFYVAQALKACGFFDSDDPLKALHQPPKGYNFN